MHIHIIGICGTFMGGIAQLARAAGHQVTGCDANVYPPMSDILATCGVTLIEGYSAQTAKLKPDIFVVGNAISRGNPLMEHILNEGLPFVSGPQWLAEHVLRQRWVLGVAGTHGKTTTSSLLTWILEDAGLKPGYLIGGVPLNFSSSAALGESPYFVVEADEYDTAFFDKRSKFIHYRPRTTVLNNLEFDHADIFADLAAIETQFHHLVRTLPGNGCIISNAKEAALERVLARGCWTPVQRFNNNELYASGDDASGRFSLFQQQQLIGETEWTLSGEHNRANACAALLAAAQVGVPLAQGIASLGRFKNVKRRLETIGTLHGVTLYDDFAHHPSAIATTIAGLRQKVGAQARIFAIFEPRSNTMKQGSMKDRLPESLQQADIVCCYDANLGWDAREVLSRCPQPLIINHDLPQFVDLIVKEVRANDHLLIMSNGSFSGIHQQLIKKVGDKFAAA